jgi:3-oxoacyl-[acyl-carrier protein] reductase
MKNIIIAGANSTIAQELINQLSNENYNIFCLSREGVSINNSNFHFTQMNVVEDELPDDFLPDKIHGAVYFPGTINLKPFKRLKMNDFQNDMEVNAFGAVRFIQWILPKMEDQSSMALFSSVAVQTGMPFHASISMAKGALEGLTRSLAAEFAPKIRVNAIALSLTHTKLADRLVNSEDKLQRSKDRHPVKEIGNPAHIAELTKFLLSDSSQFITGQIIPVDGGISNLKI